MAPLIKRGFICDADRHIWRYGGVAVAIYNKLLGLTSRSIVPVYYTSQQKMAEYLGCHIKTCYNAFDALEQNHWIVAAHTSAKPNPFRPKDYVPVTHDEWIRQNGTDQCYVRESTPWDGEEQDGLAPMLHRASRGKVTFWSEQTKSVKKLLPDLTDDQRARDFEAFLSTLIPPPSNAKMWKQVPWLYIKYLQHRHADENTGVQSAV